MFLTLYCADCENTTCPRMKYQGKCTKQVSDLVYDQYQHLLLEKWPNVLNTNFPSSYVSRTYKEIIDFLYDEIYT